MVRDIIDTVPMWGALLITIGLVLTANELGFRIGVFRSDKQAEDGSVQVVSMTGAHLGLLAFILAFSFSPGPPHHRADERRSNANG